MSVHGLPKHICPYCLKQFETKQGVKAHQKATRHTVEHMSDGAAERRAERHQQHLFNRAKKLAKKARS